MPSIAWSSVYSSLGKCFFNCYTKCIIRTFLTQTILEVRDGTEIIFVHGDPSHTHVEVVKDKDGKVVWETIPVEHP